MKLVVRSLLLVGLLALGYWAWTIWFPNPKVEIRHRLERLAQLASFGSDEGALSKLAGAQKLARFFSETVQIKVAVPGVEEYDFDNRDELIQAVVAARSAVKSLKARFSDMNIEVTPGKGEAIVDLTLNADIGDDKDSVWEGLKFSLKKIHGDWLVTRIDTVNLLK